VRFAGDHAAAAVLEAIDVDAERARHAAQQIRSIRKSSQLAAFALDLLCAALAVFAAGLALASHRNHTALLQRRSDELEQFAGRVAHDILSPLSTVRLAIDRELRSRDDTVRNAEMLVRASRSVGRVQTIIDGLLLFAKAGAEPETGARCDAADIVRDVVAATRPAAEERGIELRVDAADALQVGCSSGVLMSVVSNLLNNAIKYIGAPDHPRVEVRAWARDATVHIEVQDNGSGMAADVVPTIFEPYVRGQAGAESGIGLGLATVRRIVLAHRGSVKVETALGRGSTFVVELPLDSSPGGRARSRAGPSSGPSVMAS